MCPILTNRRGKQTRRKMGLDKSIRRRCAENANMSRLDLTEEITRAWGVNRKSEWTFKPETCPIGIRRILLIRVATDIC